MCVTNARGYETHLFYDGLELSDAVLETRSFIFSVWVGLVNLIDAESGL